MYSSILTVRKVQVETHDPGWGAKMETAQKPTCAASGSLPQMAVQTGMAAPSGRSLAASQSPTPVSIQSNSPRQVGLRDQASVLTAVFTVALLINRKEPESLWTAE